MKLKTISIILGSTGIISGLSYYGYKLLSDHEASLNKQKEEAKWKENEKQAKKEGREFKRKISEIKKKIKDPEEIIKYYHYNLKRET